MHHFFLTDERWGEVMSNLDLLFSKLGELDSNQHKFEARCEAKWDVSGSVLEQLLKGPTAVSETIGDHWSGSCSPNVESE